MSASAIHSRPRPAPPAPACGRQPNSGPSALGPAAHRAVVHGSRACGAGVGRGAAKAVCWQSPHRGCLLPGKLLSVWLLGAQCLARPRRPAAEPRGPGAHGSDARGSWRPSVCTPGGLRPQASAPRAGESWRLGASPRPVVRSRGTGAKAGGHRAQVSARPRGSRACVLRVRVDPELRRSAGAGCLGAAPFCVVPLSSLRRLRDRGQEGTLLTGGTPCVLEAEAVP